MALGRAETSKLFSEVLAGGIRDAKRKFCISLSLRGSSA